MSTYMVTWVHQVPTAKLKVWLKFTGNNHIISSAMEQAQLPISRHLVGSGQASTSNTRFCSANSRILFQLPRVFPSEITPNSKSIFK